MSTLTLARRPAPTPQTSRRPHALPQASLNTAIFGLGGLGVVGLTRLLAEALQTQFARVATVETRGIAQRRAPVRSTVRAGAAVRSASAPEAIDLAVALEATEALRAAPLLHPGTRCLHADLWIAPSGAGAREAPPDVGAMRRALEYRGIEVMPLDLATWLQARRLNEVLVSTVAFGALVALIGLPSAQCEELLLRRLSGKARDDNQAAFQFGAGLVGAGVSRASIFLPTNLEPVVAYRGDAPINDEIDGEIGLEPVLT